MLLLSIIHSSLLIKREFLSLLILIVAFVCSGGGSYLKACQHCPKSESVTIKSDLTSTNLTTTPTPAYKHLMAIEFNTPKLNPKDQVYVASLDVPSEYKRLFVETQYHLNDVIGGYMNFNQIIYRKSGSNVDAQPVFDRLIAIKYSGYEDGYTVQEVQDRASCLTGSDPGGWGTKRTNPHSICIMDYEFLLDPHQVVSIGGTSALQAKLTIVDGIAHEYFHHFQRAHALDRGLDYQYGHSSVGAPTWWIEGAASLFNRLWTLQEYSNISELKGLQEEQVTQLINLPEHYTIFLKQVQGVISWDDRGIDADWYLSQSDERYDTMTPNCDVMLVAAYLAHLTSYQTLWIDIPQDYYELGFKGSFEKNTGMTLQAFYDCFNGFMHSRDPNESPPVGFFPTEPINTYADFWRIRSE